MKNLLEDFEKRMLNEPAISIHLSNEMKWSAEIYSYLVDYTPTGGRHHTFEADTFEELVKKIDVAIKENEE